RAAPRRAAPFRGPVVRSRHAVRRAGAPERPGARSRDPGAPPRLLRRAFHSGAEPASNPRRSHRARVRAVDAPLARRPVRGFARPAPPVRDFTRRELGRYLPDVRGDPAYIRKALLERPVRPRRAGLSP